MPSDDYFVADDIDALRRENELLSLESTYLKGRIALLEQELARRQQPTEQVVTEPPADDEAMPDEPDA